MSSVSGSQYSRGGRSSRPMSTSTNVSIVSTHPVPYVSNQYKKQMNSTSFGPGKKLMCYAVICVVAAVIFLALGATLLGLRTQGQLYVSDQVEFIGPLFIVLFFIAMGIGVFFITRARKSSNKARETIRFHPDGANSTSATASINGTGYLNDNSSIAAVSMATSARTGTSLGGSRAGGSILMDQPQEELLSGSVTAKGVRPNQHRQHHNNSQPKPSTIPDDQRRYKPNRAPAQGQGLDTTDQQRPPRQQQTKKEATF